jgi:xanthine dehydrogenase YagS FAD-binding subunit
MTDVRLVLGGVAPTPLRSLDAEAALEGRPPTEAAAAHAADAALTPASPLAHNAFKLDLARALILRAVVRLTESG